MEISSILDALKRRFLWIVSVFVLACVAAFLGWSSTSTVYDATTVAVVVPANIDAEGKPTNALANVGFATTQLATLATVVAESPAVANEIQRTTSATLVSADNTTQQRTSAPSPGIQITVITRAKTEKAAAAGGEAAVRLMGQQLTDLQQRNDVPQKQQAHVDTLLPPESTASSSRSRLRAGGGLFLGVLGLGLVTVLVLDGLARRRHKAAPEDGLSEPAGGAGGRRMRRRSTRV